MTWDDVGKSVINVHVRHLVSEVTHQATTMQTEYT